MCELARFQSVSSPIGQRRAGQRPDGASVRVGRLAADTVELGPRREHARHRLEQAVRVDAVVVGEGDHVCRAGAASATFRARERPGAERSAHGVEAGVPRGAPR